MEIHLSQEMKSVLENSRRTALDHNNAIISPQHLLLALLSDRSGEAYALIGKIAGQQSVEPLLDAVISSLDKLPVAAGGEPA